MRNFFLLLFVTLPFTSLFAHAEYSITFDEFKKRLGNLFDEERFTDLRSRLPQDFEIWGYDVGDFSGDDEDDLAVSVIPKGLKGKIVHVYFLVSDGGSFIEASKVPVKYFEIPIEVGFTIERGICFMTSKEKNHHWFITGYTFRDGSFLLVDRFEVGRRSIVQGRKSELGYEVYNNYLNLSSSESFFNVSNGKIFLKALYYTFPAYRETRKMLPDFALGIRDTSSKYFLSGKDFWTGATDLSFSARLSYDDFSLYCLVDVTDDFLSVLPLNSSGGDRVVLWFDTKATRLGPSMGDAPNFRLQGDEDVISVSVTPGDFKTQRPHVNLLLRREPSDLQRKGIKQIGVVARKKAGGYGLRVRIPFSALGLEKRPESLGFTLEVDDVDSRGSQSKSIATSQLREWDPSTFGLLRFVPDRGAYGEVRNLSIEKLLKRLSDVGI